MTKISVNIQLCGLAEAYSSGLKLVPLCPPLAMLPVWKMNKAQLIEECKRREIAFSDSWTCPELRTVLTADKEYENRNRGVAVP